MPVGLWQLILILSIIEQGQAGVIDPGGNGEKIFSR